MNNVRPKLIVGLGNPGDEYKYTRHNIGVWFLHALALRHNGTFKADKKFHGEVAEIFIDGHKLRLLFPTTYMNLSGQSIRAVTDYYSIAPEEVLVVHDELDLPIGEVRLKFSGGHGGHNGLRDTDKHIGKKYWRLRLGVDHPGDKKKVSNYLTKNKPSRQEEEVLLVGIKKSVDDFPELLRAGYEKMMLKWHTKLASTKGINPKKSGSKKIVSKNLEAKTLMANKVGTSKPQSQLKLNTTQSVETVTEKITQQKNQIERVNLIKRSSAEAKQLHAKTAFALAFEKAQTEEE